jgi:hypothetical protein
MAEEYRANRATRIHPLAFIQGPPSSCGLRLGSDFELQDTRKASLKNWIMNYFLFRQVRPRPNRHKALTRK